MIQNVAKRIAALEAAAKLSEAKRRLHDPFILCRPWSILKNQFYLDHYPEGLFRKPKKMGPMTYEELVKLVNSFPRCMLCDVSLWQCSEWLFAFHNFSDHSKLYTEDQLSRSIKKDLESSPELAFMLTDEGKWILEAMLKCPQNFFVSVGNLRDAIEKNK